MTQHLPNLPSAGYLARALLQHGPAEPIADFKRRGGPELRERRPAAERKPIRVRPEADVLEAVATLAPRQRWATVGRSRQVLPGPTVTDICRELRDYEKHVNPALRALTAAGALIRERVGCYVTYRPNGAPATATGAPGADRQAKAGTVPAAADRGTAGRITRNRPRKGAPDA